MALTGRVQPLKTFKGTNDRVKKHLEKRFSKFSKLDASKPTEALSGASNSRHCAQKPTKTLLVHPFNQQTERKTKTYLLELPKDLKRKTPLLEIPKDFRKKPKPFTETKKITETIETETNDTESEVEMRTTSIQTEPKCCQSQKCHRCCCQGCDESDSCQSVKVIFAPAMVPSIFGTVPGIPYIVKQPVKMQEKAPQPAIPWTGIRKATEHGPVSPHFDPLTKENKPGSEDCLYLNVYTRALKPNTPSPVMVFIHGGGFVWGSGNDDNYGPDFLVEQDVVLVTFNYRLHALGFLCLDTKEVPGNAGLRDQVAALKWVQNNIQQFGGDAGNVTVFGESAGGVSTGLHVISPLSKGLFKRAIPMSGPLSSVHSFVREPVKRAFALGKELGLETDNPDELLTFLQSVPAENITGFIPLLNDYERSCSNLWKVPINGPVVEKKHGQEPFLDEQPEELLKNGAGGDIDVMCGYTDEEALFMLMMLPEDFLETYSKNPTLVLPSHIATKSNPEKIAQLAQKILDRYFPKGIHSKAVREYVTFGSHTVICYFVLCFMRLLTKSSKAKRYFYRFCCVSERNIFGECGLQHGISGASHLDDLMYLFDAKRANLKLDPNSKTYEMIKLTSKLFSNFAKYGNPTPDSSLGVKWPEYDPHSRRHVDIGDALTVGADLDADVFAFWSQIMAEGEMLLEFV